MIWFPQLQSGAITQFPVRKVRQWRAVDNRLESGERIAYEDLSSGRLIWKMDYQDLNDSEVQALSSLFSSCKGAYGSFGFVDPLANLLAWSEDLTRPDWQIGLINTQSGFVDPLGTKRAWRITNSSAGDQEIEQTLSFPGNITSCFSIYTRSDSSNSLVMRRDSTLSSQRISTSWARVSISGNGDPAGVTSTFAVRLSSGASIDLWGMQVESQPFASQYKTTGIAQGVYPKSYLVADDFTVTSTSPGRSACSVQVTSKV